MSLDVELFLTISMYCLVGLVLGEIIFRVYDIYTNYVRGQNIYEHIRRNQPNYQCYTLLFESKSDHIKFIQAGGGLDYGSGMAHSYFYGYLNKILPDNGDDNVGIRENIEKYEANENITIPVKKLFILIPLSMYFSPSLVTHAPPGMMEACKSLESIQRNVAGIIGRSYKNSVYKIHLSEMEGHVQKPLYVVAEGATPLHTLYQTCIGKAPCSAHIREHSEEIVKQFYNTLSHILESLPEYKNTYELILYEGTENLAELLVERVRKSDEYSTSWL
ncbi:stimulator of interferon genes protein-like isoform X1 [Ctenocephalides felis]|uniref:stimulator of interferon genes protein-like isoform X1 n=1 Tax=Ctenocephalides felis TaxID=7515 RepID=UPI000E6E26CB|nr:stimulator of interferon genes protein-like isoform X1 [Ctenocephalides felis]